MTKRIGQRIWPLHYYSVQVKSMDDDWIFGSAESVEWFIKYPLPIVLCVVTKAEAKLRFYHALPRFSVWATPGLPKEITLRPGEGVVGAVEEWDSGTVFCLGPPILEFTIQEAAQKENLENYIAVLTSWLRIEEENLYRISANVRTFQFPDHYLTNEALHDFDDSVTEGSQWKKVGPHEYKKTANRIKIPLSWLTYQLFERGDIAAAVKGALLLRHLFGEELPSPLGELFGHLTAAIGTDQDAFSGIDEIAKALSAFLPRLAGI